MKSWSRTFLRSSFPVYFGSLCKSDYSVFPSSLSCQRSCATQVRKTISTVAATDSHAVGSCFPSDISASDHEHRRYPAPAPSTLRTDGSSTQLFLKNPAGSEENSTDSFKEQMKAGMLTERTKRAKERSTRKAKRQTANQIGARVLNAIKANDTATIAALLQGQGLVADEDHASRQYTVADLAAFVFPVKSPRSGCYSSALDYLAIKVLHTKNTNVFKLLLRNGLPVTYGHITIALTLSLWELVEFLHAEKWTIPNFSSQFATMGSSCLAAVALRKNAPLSTIKCLLEFLTPGEIEVDVLPAVVARRRWEVLDHLLLFGETNDVVGKKTTGSGSGGGVMWEHIRTSDIWVNNVNKDWIQVYLAKFPGGASAQFGGLRYTFLHQVCQQGRVDFNFMKWLIEELKVPVNISDVRGQTPLFVILVKRKLYDKPKDTEFGSKIVQLLLQNGADVNKKDAFGITPLWAILLSNTSDARSVLLEQLLLKGADPNMPLPDGVRALDYVRTPHMKELLLKYGAKGDPSKLRIPERKLKRSLKKLSEIDTESTSLMVNFIRGERKNSENN